MRAHDPWAHTPSPGWSDVDVATLKRMYLEGQSATQIGKVVKRSRNAVIGKLTRLFQSGDLQRLKFARQQPRTAAIGPKPAKAQIKAAPKLQLVRAEPPAPEPPRPPKSGTAQAPHLPAAAAWMGRALTLLELGPKDCRYPVSPHDAATHLFCGEPARPGSAYCERCAGVMYVAQKPQVKAKRGHDRWSDPTISRRGPRTVARW